MTKHHTDKSDRGGSTCSGKYPPQPNVPQPKPPPKKNKREDRSRCTTTWSCCHCGDIGVTMIVDTTPSCLSCSHQPCRRYELAKVEADDRFDKYYSGWASY